MFIRNGMVSMALALSAAVAAFPAHGAAQDAATVLQDVQKAIGKEMPRGVRVTAAGSGYKAGTGEARHHYRIDEHTQALDPESPDSSWTTPFGFLGGAAARQATTAVETLFGTAYRVLAFTAPGGQPVRGYVNEKNELERIRTEIQEPGRGKVQIETVFMIWQDFDGLKYPTLIIHKENNEVSRILVVSSVEAGGSGAAAASAGAAAAAKP